jgi:NTE family protein
VFGQEGAPVAGVGLAVAASSAIPGYFEPVCIGRHRYVDGGVCSLVNLDLVAGLELDLVIVSSPLSQASPSLLAAPTSFVRRPLRARLHAEAAELRRAGTPVFLVEPGATVTASMGLNPMDAARRGAVSRATTRAVGEWLRVGGQGRKLASLLACAAAEGADPPSPGPVLLRRPSA